jgi:RNA polymerase sigma-70 factor (ECF subfamily)
MQPTDNINFDDLVVRAQGGDKDAFQHMVHLLLDEIRIFVAARARSFDLVDEVVQATFVTCYQSLQNYEPRGAFISWLKSIARHRLLQELQRRSKFCSLEGDALEAVLAHASGEDLESSATDDGERCELMRICLANLPERPREMLQRHHAHGISISRLAQQFKQSESAIVGTLKRIRRMVRACMESKGLPT